MRRLAAFRAFAVPIGLWLLFVAHSCSAGRPVKPHLHLGEVEAPPKIQVGLGRCLRAESVRVAVRGPWALHGAAGQVGSGSEMDWTEVTACPKGVVVAGRDYDQALTLVPAVDGTLEVEYARDHRGNPVRAAGVRYHGSLILHATPDRKVVLVNEVDLEDYLKGVVGKEMNLGEGVEALKTQVVAARSYAVHEQRSGRLRRVKGERFDLYDDERSQVYGGMERETGLASRLVDETRGMFLVWEGRLVRAFYSSSCGGHTEPAWEILSDESEKIPPLSGVACDWCLRRPSTRWKEPVVVPKKEIAEKCLPKDLSAAKVRSVEISKTLPGGHAAEVTLRLENSSRVVKLQANQEFRRILGAARFRSTLWDRIEDRGDSIAVTGRGYGHGAGMCQIGAYEMARAGKTASGILEFYFPGARVQKLY